MPAVYTRTGDKGDTGLFGGSRVAKQSSRVEAYGTIDEANAMIGLAKSRLEDEALKDQLHHIQQRLFTVGAELASDEKGATQLDGLVDAKDVADLEALIDTCLAETGPPRHFVVPGRNESSGSLHVARTLVRRAERRVLSAAETSPVRPEVVKYLNRLSDCLYAIARVCEERFTRDQVEATVRAAVEQALGAATGFDPGHGGLRKFTLAVATTMATAAQQKAEAMGVPIVFVAVDAAGNPVLLHRMEGSLLASIALAGDKAWTSSAFRAPTHEMKDRAKESGDLFGLEGSSSGRICVFGGGYPIFVDGAIAGGIGVSGGTVEEDMAIAGHAISAAMERN
ncbi:cob(I)yrinic acid a,c-diamide adenosyltransferase [Aestuariimicrobium sp. p3-SID1156]|uniref:cob(I)yrinic acid a,c-diamide adenosyltransferase n=1 Tax=Aestuariimicrobium sp. p3-SID1156 TaxID=2916038 RepID=UPI00223C4700|nr:cob(I)yrinic acid a,c-diamide adenosyltransferase [Aestuariimicrobium sp. p3-SID1156]MCT1458350.1 cob(I)yrinic acid a,c-diamide adenosyltransferase [Aestuariimicrobium sp. p3-SID1156]